MEAEVRDDEKTLRWQELTEGQKFTVAYVHASQMRQPTTKVLRLFNLARPVIVFGPKFDYCRIHHESCDVMNVILRQYL